jgi:hypothetical protein
VNSLRHNCSGCWAAYNTLTDEKYMYFILNPSVPNVDENTGTHMSMMEGITLKYHYCMIEGFWRYIKTAVDS